MKGIAIAVETIVYLILAVTVMTVALMFFLSQGGKAQTDFEIEAARNSACAAYQYFDPGCTSPSSATPDVKKAVSDACKKYSDRRGIGLVECNNPDDVTCVQRCCLACPQPKGRP